MAFRDLSEFLVVKPVVLPINGKRYEFPGAISAEAWLLLQDVAEEIQRAQSASQSGDEYSADTELVDDAREIKLRAELLGDAEAEMIADGLSSAHLKAVFYTLMAYHLSGQEMAEQVWEAHGSQGEAPAPNREARRAAAKSTRSRGSHAGSTRRGGTTASPGAPSSSTGD